MQKFEYDVGTIVEMKKAHPCEYRTKQFEIIRNGADIKIKCLGCGNVIWLRREIFNKRIKKIIK